MYLRTCTSGLRVESHPANCSFCCCQVVHTLLVSSSVIHTNRPRHFLLCLQVTTANWTSSTLYTVAQPFKGPGVEWLGVMTCLARLAHHSEPRREVKPAGLLPSATPFVCPCQGSDTLSAVPKQLPSRGKCLIQIFPQRVWTSAGPLTTCSPPLTVEAPSKSWRVKVAF